MNRRETKNVSIREESERRVEQENIQTTEKINEQITEQADDIEDKNREKMNEEKMEILTWNIAGANNAIEAQEFIQQNDIVVLLETWHTKEAEENTIKRMSKEFTWYSNPATKKKGATRGRAAGGLLVGIKKNIVKEWIINEWSFGLSLCRGKEINVITVYNNVGISKIKTQIDKILEFNLQEYDNVVVLGDQNARIGREVGYELLDENIIHFRSRQTKDPTVNEEKKNC